MSRENKVLIDLSYLKEVSNDNTEFIVEMIDIFLAQTPDYVLILNNAIAEQDWSKIAEMAHKIKPTLGFMGADSAKGAMSSIESRAKDKQDYEGIVNDFQKFKEDFDLIFSELKEKRKELLANS